MFRASSWWVALLFVLALAAFWPRYLIRLPEVDAYAHTHALLMTIWMAFLIVQPQLIRRERRALHRVIGRTSYVLVPVILISSFLLSHSRAAAIPAERIAIEAPFVYLGIGAMLNFLVYYILAVWHRARTPIHARYMIATVLPLIDPITARLLGFYAPPLASEWLYAAAAWLIVSVTLLVLAVGDRSQPREVRRVVPVVFAVYALFQIPIVTFSYSDWWRAFVVWYSALPIT